MLYGWVGTFEVLIEGFIVSGDVGRANERF
jgi:hypothetical protein